MLVFSMLFALHFLYGELTFCHQLLRDFFELRKILTNFTKTSEITRTCAQKVFPDTPSPKDAIQNWEDETEAGQYSLHMQVKLCAGWILGTLWIIYIENAGGFHAIVVVLKFSHVNFSTFHIFHRFLSMCIPYQ